MPSASLVQISTSRGGIPKRPIPEASVTPLGLDGDDHNNPNVHGGPNKAVLWITSEGIDELVAKGFPLYAGALGENLTTTGVDRRAWRPGQRWQIGEVILQLTKLRTPCNTITVYGANIGPAVYDKEANAGDPSSANWGLGGIYASVVQPGRIRVGDSITLLNPPPAA